MQPVGNGQAKIVVVPCSGIGKTYGTVTREAAYIVVEELAPETTCIVPLSLLVLGDEEAQAAVRGVPVVTLDGCKLACATVNVGEAGGHVAREFTVLDCYRRNRQCKPKGIAELNEGGQALAQALAEEVVQAVAEIFETRQD
ncbi:MAG: hypothetical protein KDI03_05915 [Anaerolineae bacterium]|nr:hypothetical protein [Anaerolineae bacterium]MCB0206905.1 hypothetical protein [Anaerolineae bacterium]